MGLDELSGWTGLIKPKKRTSQVITNSEGVMSQNKAKRGPSLISEGAPAAAFERERERDCGRKRRMNQNTPSGEGRHDNDSALSDFLASLMDYTPTIPDELVEHYIAKSGFQCPDVRLIRLVAIATQKFISEVATDALRQCKARQVVAVKDKKEKQQKDKRLILTMEDLSKALREYGVNMKHQEYFTDSPSTGMDPASREE
ncbi:transcription initiation factor TFIID subunit 10-like [Macadamia integrifolia]|uniref:transcription initiation factor TFIID subunit 10-like n=1 Tax=Macadamia integrifolia TaxID=60698 RepID=UPI001C4F8012|nr:transcription initiation factor TFIID subunit 10-like [Macadamia integrifolia]